MAKLLLIEKDPVSAAVLEDRLRVAGHRVEMLADAAQAAGSVDERQIDLVVLGLPDGSSDPGVILEPIRALRAHPGARSVGVVALSDGNEPAWRVAVLRAGADDVLARPFDPEELEIRVERLLGSRTASLQLLQGDLANHPLWAVLQYLRQVSKTGHLRVRGGVGSGTIDLREGELVGARWQGLRGSEALLTLLSVEQGSFRFDASDPGEVPAQATEELFMHELLMQAAWLKDELDKRRQLLPAAGEPLVALSETLPENPDFSELPLQRVLSRIRRQPGTRLFDLIVDEAEAPLTTRLAVAVLCESGTVAPRDQAPRVSPQNTMEISNAIVFDIAVADLVAAAAAAKLPADPVPGLVLVEPPVWPRLRRLIETAPGFPGNEGMRALIEHVEHRRAGSAIFAGIRGKLALHVQILAAAEPPQLAALVPDCAAVLIWLHEGEAQDQARNVVQRLEASPLPATGMLIAGTPAAQQAAARLAEKTRKWRTSPHAPQSLLGALRLMHPR